MQRSAQLMKGMSGAEANAAGGGWEMEEPRCAGAPSIEMLLWLMLAICGDEKYGVARGRSDRQREE